MRTLVEAKRCWELVVEVGNDFGEPSYMETEEYDTKETLEHALKYLDYYSIPQSVKEVVEYAIHYPGQEELD